MHHRPGHEQPVLRHRSPQPGFVGHGHGASDGRSDRWGVDARQLGQRDVETADPNPANNSATASLIVTTSADVSIVKSGPASITANTDGVYTLTVSNAGPSQATESPPPMSCPAA